MLIYGLTLDAHFGGVQEAFTLARSLADFTQHTIIVQGNAVTVEVTAGMTDDDCHTAYDAALAKRGPKEVDREYAVQSVEVPTQGAATPEGDSAARGQRAVGYQSGG